MSLITDVHYNLTILDKNGDPIVERANRYSECLTRYNNTRTKEDRVELRIGLDSGPVYIIKDLNGAKRT